MNWISEFYSNYDRNSIEIFYKNCWINVYPAKAHLVSYRLRTKSDLEQFYTQLTDLDFEEMDNSEEIIGSDTCYLYVSVLQDLPEENTFIFLLVKMIIVQKSEDCLNADQKEN